MAVDMAALAERLDAETELLVPLLASLDPAVWATPTPAEGWRVTEQVSHLAYFDDAARTATVDPDRFREERDAALAAGFDLPERVAREHAARSPEELWSWFRAARREMLDALRTVDGSQRVPWYGPDMSAASALTARVMETWAHGQDVYDALGVAKPAEPALRDVADLGVRTRAYSFVVRGLAVPEVDVRVELVAPDGERWAWGDPDAEDRVTGAARGFALLVTQRRARSEVDVETRGPVAQEWMDIAQCFAGPPGPGRSPR